MLAAETGYIYIYNASNDNIQVKGVKGHSAHWENKQVNHSTYLWTVPNIHKTPENIDFFLCFY
jgi:hypothetical protein